MGCASHAAEAAGVHRGRRPLAWIGDRAQHLHVRHARRAYAPAHRHPRSGPLYWLQYYGDYKRFATNAQRDAAPRGRDHVRSSAYFSPFFRWADRARATVIGALASPVSGSIFFSLLDGRSSTAAPSFRATRRDVRPMVINERLATQLFPGHATAARRAVTARRLDVRDHRRALEVHVGLSGISQSDVFILTQPPGMGSTCALVRARHGATIGDTNTSSTLWRRSWRTRSARTPRRWAFASSSLIDPRYHYQGFHVALILAVTCRAARRLRERREHAARSRHRPTP